MTSRSRRATLPPTEPGGLAFSQARATSAAGALTELKTERLLLRTWRPGDLDDLARVFADPQVWRPAPEGRGSGDVSPQWVTPP
jgi:RimJ/RimL family protein N-acetyltransferase